MGGSRCTYRNCTVRSDGVVHMFHYPVYDKNRCHQWLVNAHRLDFLNLKLTQVRNRVVCQHHFKDECFMNYLKEKLKFDAIPTEDGPHCEPIKDKELPIDQISKTYTVALNHIDENDKYAKTNIKANSSLIYADFLTNGDEWEKQSLNETIWNNMVITSKELSEADKVPVVWHKIDETQPKEINENSMITLTDLIGDTSNTKITEFENPILANITFSQNKPIQHNIEQTTPKKETQEFKETRFYKKHKNQKKSKISAEHQNSNSLLINQETTGACVNQDQNYEHPDTNLNNLLVSQGNNSIIVNFDNFGASNNTTSEKLTELVIDTPADKKIQNFSNINNTSQVGETMQLITSADNYCAIIQNPNELALQVEQPFKPEEFNNFKNYISIDQYNSNQILNNSINSNIKKPKVTILSETTLKDPVVFQGQLEPVSTSALIQVSKNTKLKPVTKIEEVKIEYEKEIEELKSSELDPPVRELMQKADQSNISKLKNSNPTDVLKPPNFKHKIAPERVAAIEKKRNFNKRLRDIIEICLDKLDDQDKASEVSKAANIVKSRSPKEKLDSLKQNVATYLSKQAELPTPQEYMMKFLETRMKRMEDTLLSKIDQNSQRIVELKKTISRTPQPNKVTGTQTSQSEEAYKKRLYNEISQFLSPNINSLIYEELFINKYSQNVLSDSSTPKKRKCR